MVPRPAILCSTEHTIASPAKGSIFIYGVSKYIRILLDTYSRKPRFYLDRKSWHTGCNTVWQPREVHNDYATDSNQRIIQPRTTHHGLLSTRSHHLPHGASPSPSVEVDEPNIGTLGLIDAADRHDASRGVPFKAYAEIRIQGSMFDALRETTGCHARCAGKSTESSTPKTLTFSLGRDPSAEEMANAMDLSMDEYEALTRDAQIKSSLASICPLRRWSHPSGEIIPGSQESVEATLCNEELAAKSHTPSLACQKKSVSPSPSTTCKGLLKEIGEILDVPESLACQLRGQGVQRL